MYRMAALAALAAGLMACKNEQGIAEIRIEQVAAVSGDFDRIESSLLRNGVQTEIYEGYINAPVYDVDEDAEYGQTPLQVEKLFTELDTDGDPLLLDFDALFLNSGVRGLGEFVYNDVDPNALVSDPEVVETLRSYVARRRTPWPPTGPMTSWRPRGPARSPSSMRTSAWTQPSAGRVAAWSRG